MTSLESTIVSRLRSKAGDNPTKSYTNFITNAVYNSGDESVTVTTNANHTLVNGTRVTIRSVLGMTDLNNYFDISNASAKVFDVPLTTAQTYISGGVFTEQLTANQIWTDEELLEVLDSARVTEAKGKAFDAITEFDLEIVLLRARIELNTILAQDSARYARYTLRDVNAEKVSPQEIIKIADSLEERLEKLKQESDDESLGSTIHQSVIRVVDPQYDISIPTEFEPDITVPVFTLTNVAGTGVQIDIPYAFISVYRTHFIKKKDGSTGLENILINYYSLQTSTYTDTEVADGVTYTYTLYIETLNGVLYKRELSITYAA